MINRVFFAMRHNVRGLASSARILTNTITKASGSNIGGAQMQFNSSVRGLSYSSHQSQSVAKELESVLQSEIEQEKKLEQENLGGSSPPQISGFKIYTEEGEVRLTKKYKNEEILVVFNVSNTVGLETETDDLEEEHQTQAQNEEENPVSLPQFSIEITKGDQCFCFNLDMVNTENGYDYAVEEFYILPKSKAKDSSGDMPSQTYASSGRYIDSGLQDMLFVKFLEERGFTQEFCHQLIAFATHYEHKQYVQLLEKIKKFVAE